MHGVIASEGSVKKRPHIAVFHTWPEIKNAEYEIVARLIDASRLVGIDMSIVDNHGYVLWSTKPTGGAQHRIGYGECDFAISLHFESPKTIDVHSYAAIWNPLDFYFSWGYEQTVNKFLTHNDLLSCGSDFAEAHALNLLRAFGRVPPLPLPRLYHTVPRTDYKPSLNKDSRVFYVGINWERINNERGRHHDILLGLDKAGLIDIYGPETFQGIKPWEGYQGYRGSIPFDGSSLVRRIARSGICLAFSSASHQRSGIMSSRLFEGLAAGALVIANRHPFVEKYFKDKVHVVDDSLPPEAVLSQVVDIVEQARANPAQANKLAKEAQDHFLENFSLDQCLVKLTETHASRVAVTPPSAHSVDVFVKFTSVRLSRLVSIVRMLERQRYPLQTLTIILDAKWHDRNKFSIDNLIDASKLKIIIVTEKLFDYADDLSGDLSGTAWRSKPIGSALFDALASTSADSFILLQPEDEIFHDHIDALVRSLFAKESQLMASSGVLIEGRLPDMRFERRLAYLFPRVEDYVTANQVRYSASHIYRREILRYVSEDTFKLLDGEEHNLFNHIAFSRGQIGFSNYASYVFLDHEDARRLEPFVPVEQQHQYIRDTQRADIQQLAFLRVTPLPQVVFASPVGTPITWEIYRHARDRATKVGLGKRYDLRAKSDGLRLLARGFYGAEADGVWVEGKFGELEFVVDEQVGVTSDKSRYALRLELEGRNDPETKKRQFVSVVANGFTIGETLVEAQWAEYKFEFGSEVFDSTRSMKLRLLLGHAGPILGQDDEVLDSRSLGLRLRSLTLA